MPNEQRPPLRKLGGAWKPRPGSKAVMSGSITVNGFKQKFLVFENTKKSPDSNEPDYHLLSSEGPEVDPYAKRSPDVA